MSECLNFFSHEKISDRLYHFTEGYSMVHRFTIGVIVGDEKIMVIDAGLGGTPNLRKYIESVVGTDKPIICAVTHGHPDHAGSALLFDEAYCSALDWPRLQTFAFPIAQRLEDLHGFALDNNEVQEYCTRNIIDNTTTVFKDVKDGDVFDLGGVKIEAIHIPGHSDGSMAYFNREEKYVFTGDGVNTDTHIKKMNREDMRNYANVLRRFVSIVGDDVTVYPAHLPLTMDISVAKNLITACEEIADGKTYGDPPGETIFAARTNNPDIRMHFVGNTAAVYNGRLCEAEPIGDYINFYSHEKVSEHVWIVTENYSMVHRFTIGVVEGEKKALVIDSGLGMDQDLRKYIESFIGTEKPLECAMTHGHLDHLGAACLFDVRYMSHRDCVGLERQFDPVRRRSDLDAFGLHNNIVNEYGAKNMIVDNSCTFTDIDEGDVLDLGGVTVRPIRTTGHSKGHLAYYVPEDNIAFGGDGINIDIHLKSMPREGFEEYIKTMERFISMVPEDVRIFAGHLNRAHRINVPRNIIAACKEILNGDTAGDPPGETIFAGRTNNPDIRMHYHGGTCIVYNRSLV